MNPYIGFGLVLFLLNLRYRYLRGEVTHLKASQFLWAPLLYMFFWPLFLVWMLKIAIFGEGQPHIQQVRGSNVRPIGKRPASPQNPPRSRRRT